MEGLWGGAQAALGAGGRLSTAVDHGRLDDLRQVFAAGTMGWRTSDQKLTNGAMPHNTPVAGAG
jgi:hypothetical protein